MKTKSFYSMAAYAAGVAGLFAMGAVGAASGDPAANAVMQVSVSVPKTCTVTAPALAFPDYDLDAGSQTNAGLTADCTTGAAYSIQIGAGNNASGVSGYDRAMKSPSGELIGYDLYQESNRTTKWNTTQVVDFVNDNTTQETPKVYGAVGSGQQAPAGTYTDDVNVEIFF